MKKIKFLHYTLTANGKDVTVVNNVNINVYYASFRFLRFGNFLLSDQTSFFDPSIRHVLICQTAGRRYK